jgi:hypothetical protein
MLRRLFHVFRTPDRRTGGKSCHTCPATALETGMPFRRSSRYAAYLFILIIALALFTNGFDPRPMDFISFWVAAKLAIGGNFAAAYDPVAHEPFQRALEAAGGLSGFVYPPPFLFAIIPFGLLPYGIAAGAWVVGTFALYLLAADRLAGEARWQATAFPPVLMNGIIGQIGYLTGAIFIAAASQLQRRPILAGALFGCLIIKPQLGLLLPVAFVAGRAWKAFAGAACSVLVLLLLSYLAFGGATFVATGKALSDQATLVFSSPLSYYKMTSIYAALQLAGLTPTAAGIAHGVVASLAAGLTWWIWSRPGDLDSKVAILATATTLISPYFFLYDAVILIIPFFWLAGRGLHLKTLVLLWAIMLAHLAQGAQLIPFHNVMPVVPLTLLFLICRNLPRANPA